MTEKKAYPLRISTQVLDAVQRWAEDELRSTNAQIEYLLRDALRRAGRLPRRGRDEAGDGGTGGHGGTGDVGTGDGKTGDEREPQ